MVSHALIYFRTDKSMVSRDVATWDMNFYVYLAMVGVVSHSSIRILKSPTLTILTYLLTPRSRAPLENLTGSAASQEIPRIFGTRRFLTLPTSAHHLSLS